MWGLKRWYPVERSEDPIANAKRSRIINDDDDDSDDNKDSAEEENELDKPSFLRRFKRGGSEKGDNSDADNSDS